MATIIAGRFEQQGDTERTIAELLAAGFRREHIASFYLNPPGQHATHTIGGDYDKSPGAKSSGTGVAAGVAAGAAAGVAATPVLGPLGPVAGGLVGAHLGGLVGGLSSMKEDGDPGERGEDVENALPVRQAGMYVAIVAADEDGEDLAAETLLRLGASDIERARGSIVNGDWTDFDPSAPPEPYAGRAPQQRMPSGPAQRA